MNNKAKQSHPLENLEAIVERDLQDALLTAPGVDCTWQPGQLLMQDCVTIAEDAQAQISYPWNPAEAEAFFSQTDRLSILDELSADEVSDRSHQFFSQLDSLWATAGLQNLLSERFAVRLPQPVLSAIVQRAKAIATTSASLADQLVQCVQDLLPGLTELVEEDIYVLARPLAHSMRGEAPTDPLTMVRSTAWEQLSETEQVRLSLAVARCALDELKGEKS